MHGSSNDGRKVLSHEYARCGIIIHKEAPLNINRNRQILSTLNHTICA